MYKNVYTKEFVLILRIAVGSAPSDLVYWAHYSLLLVSSIIIFSFILVLNFVSLVYWLLSYEGIKRKSVSIKKFLGDGRWRQVIRRCASVADTGVTGVCNWGVYVNGDYWEECYCSEDECNSSDYKAASLALIAAGTLLAVNSYLQWRLSPIIL